MIAHIADPSAANGIPLTAIPGVENLRLRAVAHGALHKIIGFLNDGSFQRAQRGDLPRTEFE